MYPMAPPRNRNTMRKGKFLTSLYIVVTKDLLLAWIAEAALEDGGVGGNEVLNARLHEFSN